MDSSRQYAAMDEASKRYYAQALEKVDPAYREAFFKFVIHDEADPEFLRYLDSSKDAQVAVDMAFHALAGTTIEGLVNEIQNLKEPEN
jgi:hypothetical protein